MKTPLIEKLNAPNLLTTSQHYKTSGKLAISKNKLVYLDVDDNYIHQLFPLLPKVKAQKPNYFGKDAAGAHITVIYPEEKTEIVKADLGQVHQFTIKELVAAQIGEKTYYALLVESPSLLKIRKKYHLSDLLNFKGYAISFHITIGVQST